MTLKEQEATLLKKWKRKYNVFTYDGLFDEKEFLAPPIKILYVLKEANWPGLEGNLHLVDWLLSEKKFNLLENMEQHCQMDGSTYHTFNLLNEFRRVDPSRYEHD